MKMRGYVSIDGLVAIFIIGLLFLALLSSISMKSRANASLVNRFIEAMDR